MRKVVMYMQYRSEGENFDYTVKTDGNEFSLYLSGSLVSNFNTLQEAVLYAIEHAENYGEET